MSKVAIDAALYDSIDGPLTYKEFLRVRNAVIEQCARMADKLSAENKTWEIAAAIRALKAS